MLLDRITHKEDQVNTVKKQLMSAVVVVVLVGIALMAAVQTFAQTSTPDSSSPLGRWISVACELRPGPQYLKRDFTISKDSWVGKITIFADATCTTPSVVLNVEGPIVFGKAVDVAKGAVETDFSGKIVKFTPRSNDMVGYLNSAKPNTCGAGAWKLDVEQDVSATVCGLFKLEVPFTENDISLVQNSYLFAGARPLDGSGLRNPNKRPTALQAPLIRADVQK